MGLGGRGNLYFCFWKIGVLLFKFNSVIDIVVVEMEYFLDFLFNVLI